VPERLDRAERRLEALRHRLGRCVLDQASRNRFHELSRRLHLAHPQRRLDQAQGRLALLRQRLIHLGPSVAGEVDIPRVHEARRRLLPAMAQIIAIRKNRLEVLEAKVRGVDPMGPLQRGFALVKDQHGNPVTSSKTLPAGSAIGLKWLDGERKGRLE
jgi:exodeoxyribonuclease VII large subunit